MMLRFLSVNFPEQHGYLIASSYDLSTINRSQELVVSWARQYDTYGDREVQHCTEYNVPRDRLYDFLESLAEFFLSAHEEEKEFIVGLWPKVHVSINEVRFLATLKCDEKKDRYYNLREKKITASAAKQYDKRWSTVPSWASGTAMDIYALLNLDPHNYWHNDLLGQYIDYAKIVEIGRIDPEFWGEQPYRFCKITEDWQDKHWDFDRIVTIVSKMVDGWRTVKSAREAHESYLENKVYKAKRDLERAAEQEAKQEEQEEAAVS